MVLDAGLSDAELYDLLILSPWVLLSAMFEIVSSVLSFVLALACASYFVLLCRFTFAPRVLSAAHFSSAFERASQAHLSSADFDVYATKVISNRGMTP